MTAAISPMTSAHLQELIDLEERYWWHVSKRRLVGDLLRRFVPSRGNLVEGGVGSARNLREWEQMGYRVEGFDVMPESVEHACQRGLAARVHDLEQPWPVESGSCRAVILLDVIEHTEHPEAVLRHAADALAPGGCAIVTVPAYPALYSAWDRLLGHYRRYTRHELRREAQEAGLAVEWLSHWNAVTLPPALLVRTVERLTASRKETEFPRVSRWVNSALCGALSMERRLLSWCRIPCGLSLVAVLRKS